jgi:Condensation domain
MTSLEGIEEIYGLTPLQQGMLFQTLYAPESSIYNLQLELVLDGNLDEGALERATDLRRFALRLSGSVSRDRTKLCIVRLT